VTFASALYEGPVVHARVRPKRHRLRYDVFSMLIDLEELPEMGRRFRVFGYNRWAPLAFYNRDHGPLTDTPLRPWVEARLAEAGAEIDDGPIRLLCYPRVMGYVFNPLSVFFCYAPSGELRAILYEVCNTFHERHTYVIPVAERERGGVRQRCDKALYVSPFVTMDSRYRFNIVPPSDTVSLAIRQEDDDGLLLAASFQGRRTPLTARALRGILVRFPLLTMKIMVGIHWEALRLWLKGVPMFTHRPAAGRVRSSVVDGVETGT
jgi:uncharacterized protein